MSIERGKAGRRRQARGRWALVAALAVSGLAAPLEARPDVLLAGAAPRGFFPWDAMGGYERPLPLRHVPYPLDVPARVEGHLALRDNVAHVALSTYLLLRFVIPGFEGNAFSPWLATGPGGHLTGSFSNLEEFGDLLSEKDAVLKWHAFVGARLVRGRTVDLYTEARYTKPSRYDFDWIALGIRIHAATDEAPRP